MAKKLISVWLSLTFLIFSTITIYAEEDVQGQFLNRNIEINGTRIANYYLEDPFFLYQGATYFPLNEEMSELLGFTVETDWESRTIKLLKKEPTQIGLAHETLKSNLVNPQATVLQEITVLVMADEMEKRTQYPLALQGVSMTGKEIDVGGQLQELKDMTADGQIPIPKLMVEELDKISAPVLQVGETLYLPIRALTGESCFGWDVYYDEYSGLYISTEAMATAQSYFDRAESSYNRGLANYIISRNKSITAAKATMLVFLFKHEADVNNIDEQLLLAMAQKESTFNTDAGSGSGARGIMQIMPSTAERYNIDPADLYDAHINIEFGAKYIGDKIKYYKDETIALSAYNQGGLAISRGTYTTRYAGRVSDAQKTLETYLVNNGYGLGT